MNGDQHVADFELPSKPGKKSRADLCWCIFDAVFDASGGIVTDREDWCEGAETTQGDDGLKPVPDELRKRTDGFAPLGRLNVVRFVILLSYVFREKILTDVVCRKESPSI